MGGRGRFSIPLAVVGSKTGKVYAILCGIASIPIAQLFFDKLFSFLPASKGPAEHPLHLVHVIINNRGYIKRH